MSAGILPSFDSLRATSPADQIADVSVSVSVRADRQRLFQMLTVAEYMEAWLVIPEGRPESRLAVTSAPDCFRIDHFWSQQIDCRITAFYRTCRRSKLDLTWRKETPRNSSTSQVSLRLCGDFERTTVALRHTHLLSNDERAWHRDFWERSLHRLCSLF
jgi:uncharacterized protein YndB with AHSA1/START domain